MIALAFVLTAVALWFMADELEDDVEMPNAERSGPAAQGDG